MAAARTPTVIEIGVINGARVIRAYFADLDDGDTWVSGLDSNVVGWIAQDADNPSTQTSVGIAVTYTASTGTFTLYPAEDNKVGYLYVFIRG